MESDARVIQQGWQAMRCRIKISRKQPVFAIFNPAQYWITTSTTSLGEQSSPFWRKKRTVGKPTAEFREETHTKVVRVHHYMMAETNLVNPATSTIV
jgi:hypothetical protein